MENSSEIPAEEPQSVADTLRVELAAANARIAVLENDLARLNDTKTPVPVSADRRLMPREALLQQTEEIAQVGHEVWDHELDRTAHVSESLANIHGLSVTNYLQKVTCLEDYYAFIVPEDLETVISFEEEFAREESYNPSSVDYRIVRADGEIRNILQISKFIPTERGTPSQSLSVFQDITRYKLIERELNESRDALEETAKILALSADIANVGHCIWDYEDEATVLVSENWTNCFGLTHDYYVKHICNLDQFLSLVHPDDRAKYREYYYGEDTRGQIDYRIIHSSGETRYVIENYLLLEDNTERLRSTVTIQDVTERRMAEAQLIQSAKLITLGEMSAGVAHEINQPLSVILLAAENIMNRVSLGSLEEDYLKKKLKRIISQTERASSIIDHLRKFGREAKEEFHIVDLSEAILGALNLMGEQLKLEQIRIHTQFDNSLPVVFGHQIQLEQMFINLLSNAFHAIRKNNPVDRTITIETLQSATGAAIVRVSDTGGGIPENIITKIFDPFFTTKGMSEGTGLGLSVSYGFVHEMGGSIKATNIDKGALFEIELPPAGEHDCMEQ